MGSFVSFDSNPQWNNFPIENLSKKDKDIDELLALVRTYGRLENEKEEGEEQEQEQEEDEEKEKKEKKTQEDLLQNKNILTSPFPQNSMSSEQSLKQNISPQNKQNNNKNKGAINSKIYPEGVKEPPPLHTGRTLVSLK